MPDCSSHRDAARAAPTAKLGVASPIPGFVTCDRRTFDMLRRARDYARSHLPVLIEGPSGTGKELLAEGVHRLSARRRGPWIAVNCGALPAGLLESELFGVRRGAFTGASNDRVGLIESADDGTLFLDEVGEMEAPTQAKLLRFLEQGEIRRLGENDVRRVDVRVVAATNRDLRSRSREGTFRADLFYRLCGAPLTVPPLVERPQDIPLLVAHILDRLASRHGVRPEIDAEVAPGLRRRRWPGNVRQLRNEVERAAVVAWAERRTISLGDFPRHEDDLAPEGPSFTRRVAAYERALIVEALERSGWNKTRAAHYLGGLKRTTLIGKMRRLGITEPGLAEPSRD